MEVKLVVVGGDAKPTEIKLKLPAIIGRGRAASLTLPHPLVSRQHCELYESGGKLFVRDMGSLNGTFVGEEKIDEAALDSGSLLTVGNVTFRPMYGNQAAAEAPADDIEFEMGDDADEGTEPMDFEFVDEDDIEEVDDVEEVEEVDEIEEVEDIEEVPDTEDEDPLNPPSPQLDETLKTPESDEKGPAEKKTPATDQAKDQPAAEKKAKQDDQFMQFLDDEDEDDDSDSSDDDDLSSFLRDFK